MVTLSGCLGASGPSDAISVTALPALTAPNLPALARRAPRHRPDAPPMAPPIAPPIAPPTAPPPRPAPVRAGPPPLPVPSTVFGQQMQKQAQDQCTASGGRLARRGSTDALGCFIQPKDAGKRCTGKSDCQGQCLARSGTCSPVIPLLGCHEVLLDSGQRVTECRE